MARVLARDMHNISTLNFVDDYKMHIFLSFNTLSGLQDFTLRIVPFFIPGKHIFSIQTKLLGQTVLCDWNTFNIIFTIKITQIGIPSEKFVNAQAHMGSDRARRPSATGGAAERPGRSWCARSGTLRPAPSSPAGRSTVMAAV